MPQAGKVGKQVGLGEGELWQRRLTGWGSPGQPMRETCSLPWGLPSSSPVPTPALAGPQQ